MGQKRKVLPFARHGREVDDPTDVARLYHRYAAELRAIAARTFPRDDADDIVQDAFVKYVRSLRTRGAPEPGATGARGTLIGMITGVGHDRARKEAQLARIAQRDTGPTSPVRRWTTTDRAAADSEIDRMVHDALQDLPSCWRVPWQLVTLGCLKPAEVAQQLNMTPGSVRAATSKANGVLRKALTRHGMNLTALHGRSAQ